MYVAYTAEPGDDLIQIYVLVKQQISFMIYMFQTFKQLVPNKVYLI